MSDAIAIAISRLAHGVGLALPDYMSDGAAGMDLVAAVAENQSVILEPGGRELVPTGFAIALPKGFEAQIRPRSGLAAKHGISVLNAPGTIDADYRGEVKVLLVNFGSESFAISRGMRIAQMVLAAVVQADFTEVDDLPSSVRGSGGFGSTGVMSGGN